MTSIVDLAEEQARRNADAIEQACVQALNLGHGVRVEHFENGTVAAIVDPTVPAGEIYHHREH